MLNANDQRFVDMLAKRHAQPMDYLLGTWARDGAIRDERIVKLRLLAFPGPELDVSKLDALESIEIDGELRRLELGKLPRLQSLDLSDSKLEALVLSGCPALTSLKVARTSLSKLPALPPKLESLDCDSLSLGTFAPRLPGLRSLSVASCSLKSLELSGVPELTSLRAEFNELKALDLSALSRLVICWCQGNGAKLTLPQAAPLERLAIGGNRVTSFDPGRYPALQMLFVDELGLEALTLANPKLGHLDCSKNALESLDLRGAAAIRTLTANGNRFAQLDLTPLYQLNELELEASVEVTCSELQKHTLAPLRERFGLPKPTKTLSKMDVFQLHALVQGYNWDDGEKRLFEVIRHPACSLATALLVYWQSQPQELTQYAKPKDAPRSEQKTVELVREIEQGVEAKRYAASPIPFDATDVNGVNLFSEDPLIPAAMRSAAAAPLTKPKAAARPKALKPKAPKPKAPAKPQAKKATRPAKTSKPAETRRSAKTKPRR